MELDQAQQYCQGILLGLYRVRDGADNNILNWAPDFPGEAAANALEIRCQTGRSEREVRLQRREAAGFHPISCQNTSGIGSGSSNPVPEADWHEAHQQETLRTWEACSMAVSG